MSEPIPMADMITLTIDGVEVSVPKGTLAIRAAEAAGIAIPRFCDHPLLDPAGACRQCLVEITDAGNGRGFPKPQPSCTTQAAQGMVIKTQATSDSAKASQEQILELLLINHPLDCPICDKGGECPLQNQALADGRTDSRFDGVKRTYPKPIALSELVLLDRERCVLCTRCTRFSDQIAGDPFIQLVERGAKQQVGIYPDEPYHSYFSGNVTQICPVGALTSSDYRFSARPFDLKSTITTCENCAAGCQLRVDARHGEVRRRMAGDCPDINEEWNCDKGRFGYVSALGDDRITKPMIRKKTGLVEASWPQAINTAVAGLKRAKLDVGVLPGGRLTVETAYAYSRFARAILHTNSVDFRMRAQSAEEASFLAAFVAGKTLEESVTYADLEKATKVVLVSFDPEDESPMVFLRLRKAVRKGLKVVTVASYLSAGSKKLNAELVGTKPSEVVKAISALEADESTIVIGGVRLGVIPGAYSAIRDMLARTGARFAWIPRRSGEVSAIEAGLLPDLLPGGRPVGDAEAREQLGALWGGNRLPSTPGLALPDMLKAASEGKIKALLTGGIEIGDLPDPQMARQALSQAFVVSLERRLSDVSEFADVIFPVDGQENIDGTYINWEHRPCPVSECVTNKRSPMTDIRVLAALAEGLGGDLGLRTSLGARVDLDRLSPWAGAKPQFKPAEPAPAPQGIQIATWRELLDDSRSIDGADALLSEARPVVARISPQTLRNEGLATSTYVRLSDQRGSVTYPIEAEPTMVDGVVWVPTSARGSKLNQTGLLLGSLVTLAAAPAPTQKEGE